MTYNDFLKSKRITTSASGFDVDKNSFNTMLFDWQKDIVKWALKKGKCALFEDCGLGKTIQQLEFAQVDLYIIRRFAYGKTLLQQCKEQRH